MDGCPYFVAHLQHIRQITRLKAQRRGAEYQDTHSQPEGIHVSGVGGRRKGKISELLTLSMHAQEGYSSRPVCHTLILEITDN